MKASYVLEMLNSGELDILKQTAEREVREQAHKQAGGEKTRLKAIQKFAEQAKARAEDYGKAGADGAWIEDGKMCIVDGYSAYRLNQIYPDVVMASDGARLDLDMVMKQQGEIYHLKAGDVLEAYAKAKLAAKTAGKSWSKARDQHIVSIAGGFWDVEFLATFAKIMGDCDITTAGEKVHLYGKNDIGEAVVMPIRPKSVGCCVCEIPVERR